MKIQWEGQYLIIINNNESIIDISSYVGESAELFITGYLAHFVREEEVEKIHFLLTQCATKAYPVPKNFGDIAKLLANIQKKQLDFYFKKLKLLKNRSVYEVVNFSKRQKAIKNY